MMFRNTRAPALAVALLALAAAGPAHARTSYPYTLVEPGTFGGPSSFLDLPAVPLTNQGTLLGAADTATSDSDFPSCPPPGGCYDSSVQHALTWSSGRLTDLGALPGENSSAIYELNDHGVGAGFSENGLDDPFSGTAAGVAAMFENGQVIDVGTLPGGHQSFAQDINDQGQVAGDSSNGIPDPFSFFGWGTQTRGFIWQNGTMTDLGTLGGADTVEYVMNGHGQIAGWSYTNTSPNTVTGLPTTDPYLWSNGTMHDLGTLGGTFGVTDWMNDHGEVVGMSDLAGDQSFHPFLWDGREMRDLGTLGGDTGEAFWVNDAGHAVGHADLADGTHHGFLWAGGVMHDLVPVDNAPCSNTFSINNHDQAVGNVTDCQGHELGAVLWDRGSAYDLNALVAPSGAHLNSAEYINDKGEIVAEGTLANRDHRIFLLIPAGGSFAGLARDAASNARSHGIAARGSASKRPHPPAGRRHARRRLRSPRNGMSGGDRRCASRACALLQQRAARF
jgi:probable HAF family extracellular repeat protein